MKKFAICILALCFAANVYAVDLGDIQIHGFISQGYLKTDNNDFYFAKTEDGSFQFNEVGINFSTELTDQLRVGIQFLSRDLGQLGNNKIEIDWAYADYRFRNWLGLRAGKIKRPYGLYNRTRDIDAARTFVMLPTMLYDDVPRDSFTATTGIGIYGYLPFGFFYEFQYGTMQIDAEGGNAKNIEWGMKTTVSDIEADDGFTAYLEWEMPFVDGLKLAGTAFSGPDYTVDTSFGKIEIEQTNYVASVEYSYEQLTFATEYRYIPFETILNDTATLTDVKVDAWYGSVSYQFSDWFTLGSYYGEFYTNKNDRDGDRFKASGESAANAWRKDFVLTTRFDINEYWVFKLEGHIMDGLVQVNTPAAEADDNWFLFAAKTTFSF